MADLTRDEAKKDLMTGVNTHQCICEALRLAYDEVHSLPAGPVKDSLTERLTDCLLMAKRMQNRLIYYRTKYETPKHRGEGLKALPGAADRLQMRQARLEA